MAKTRNPAVVTLYYVSIVLLILRTLETSWLWTIPYWLLLLFALLITFLAFSKNLFTYDPKSSKILIVYLIVALITTVLSPYFGLPLVLQNLAHTVVILSVIFLKDRYKVGLFNFFVKALSLILLITIPAWILFLVGFRFSHGAYVDIGDGFHYMHDYTFFVTSFVGEGVDFPRFSSVFLEPGWVGTICCFTLFGMGLNYKRIPSWLCILGLMLSMSLSAIVNMLVCVLLWIWQTSKHRIIWLCVFFVSLIGLTMFAVSHKNGNNALNRLVVERLVFDEDLGVAGNNRTNDVFDDKFENVIKSSDKWFGIGHETDQRFRASNDWYNSSSGIKKEIMDNGYIGTGIFMLLLVLLFIRYRNKRGFVFFVCFILASFIRNLWRNDCYLVLYIVALCNLYVANKNKKDTETIICQTH